VLASSPAPLGRAAGRACPARPWPVQPRAAMPAAAASCRRALACRHCGPGRRAVARQAGASAPRPQCMLAEGAARAGRAYADALQRPHVFMQWPQGLSLVGLVMKAWPQLPQPACARRRARVAGRARLRRGCRATTCHEARHARPRCQGDLCSPCGAASRRARHACRAQQRACPAAHSYCCLL